MAELTRNWNFLRMQASSTRRLRNLETGVHPTGTDVNYYDTYLPTAVSLESGWDVGSSGASTFPPKWQRRVGVVTMIGGVEPSGRNWSAIAAEEKLFNLPSTARPLVEITANVVLTEAPFFAQIRIEPDGDVYVLKPAGAAANTGILKLEGPNWTVN